MKYKSGQNLMDLPNYIKFGCEIELQNVDFNKLNSLVEQFPELQGWKITKDLSVTDNGIEIISPPISEKTNPEGYKNFGKVLELAKSCPQDKNRRVYVNEQCGGHIHLDATMMKKNPEMMEAFLRLWAESEVLMYKMCNAKNDPIRESAVKLSPVDGIKRMLLGEFSELIKAVDSAELEGTSVIPKIPKVIIEGKKKKITGFLLAIESLKIRNGYAHPIGKKLQRTGKNKDFINKEILTKEGTKYKFNRSLRELASHQVGINLQHISTNRGVYEKIVRLGKSKNLNTYEFRIHNSSLDLETWKQNIMLDSAFSKVAYEMAYEPDKNNKKLSHFFEKDLTEEEKANRFLELLFDSEEDRVIYRERWQSVKDEPVFKKTRGFSKTILKRTAQNTKSQVIKSTMKKLSGQVKEFLKDDRGGSFSLEDFVIDYGGRE
ncbi:MAG: hypothetical protein IJH39_07520 [Clostridia bacterium]|nr:hypothetical protein [Clostridia bacterium]